MSKLKSSAGEFVLLVVGVLFAFAIQAKWEDWQDSRQDAGYIQGRISGEMDQVLQRLPAAKRDDTGS